MWCSVCGNWLPLGYCPTHPDATPRSESRYRPVRVTMMVPIGITNEQITATLISSELVESAESVQVDDFQQEASE